MSHTLLTFLGRAPRKNGESEYPQANYRFPDGAWHSAAFVGFPLRQWLGADRLVVFGTPGSMWDHLFEGDLAIEGDDDKRLELMHSAQEQQHVTQAQLDDLAPALAGHLGCEVELRIIPDALEPSDQTELLRALAEAAPAEGRLSIDVTHGYRHLPMLALTAALYLRTLRPALYIQGLWYALYDPATGEAAVHNLAGLLATMDWLNALQRLDWLGDYGGVADLLAEDQSALAGNLREASFRESIHQGQKARSNIRQARKQLQEQPLANPGAMFQDALEQRMTWTEEDVLYLRQRRHAYAALEREDYLRATLYGFEAFVSKLTRAEFGDGQVNDYEARDQARKAFIDRTGDRRLKNAYQLLNNLRNVLAHGNQARTASAQSAIASREALEQALSDCFATLLPPATA